jgi:hypothetical protein
MAAIAKGIAPQDQGQHCREAAFPATKFHIAGKLETGNPSSWEEDL